MITVKGYLTDKILPKRYITNKVGEPIALEQWFSTIFGGVASRYFVYTAVLHLLYSCLRLGSLSYSGLL